MNFSGYHSVHEAAGGYIVCHIAVAPPTTARDGPLTNIIT